MGSIRMITDKQIQAAIKSVKTETVLNDTTGVRGGGSLQLRIRSGTKGVSSAWVAAWWTDGKPVKKSLGKYPDIGLADARRKYETEVRDVLLAGRNPNAVVVQAEAPTVEKLFQAYIQHLKDKGASTWPESERLLLTGGNAAADLLGKDKQVDRIEPSDISTVLAKGLKRGARRSTDMQRTAMAAAFTWGMNSTNDYTIENRIDWGLKYNPVTAVPRDKAANKTRDRNLSADEIRHLWFTAVDQTGDVMRLVLATGQRIIECLRIEGREVDLEARVWAMPAPKTKGRKRPHDVPLSSQAVAVLSVLKALYGDGYLFPARTGAKGATIAIQSISQAATRIEGIAKFQPRDLRRTWKSRAGDGAKISTEMRDLLQQHAQGGTGKKHYDRAEYMPEKREAMDQWDAWLAQVLQPDEPAALAA